MTSKEMYVIACWHEKQAEKAELKAKSLFSQEEKIRAETCTEGPAVNLLKSISFSYLLKHFENDKFVTKEYIQALKTNLRPCTRTLFNKSASIEHKVLFQCEESYWNMKFTSWWLKKNWSLIVDAFIEYTQNSKKLLCE